MNLPTLVPPSWYTVSAGQGSPFLGLLPQQWGAAWWTGQFADDLQKRKQGEITPAYATLDAATIREIRALCQTFMFSTPCAIR